MTQGDEAEMGSEEDALESATDVSDEESDDDSDTSSPATAGVIELVSLRNFMCHDAFDLKLGPQINFIIGRNGSGKSAILTGISVGLGAKATDTNRGSSIKSLIKEGKSMAKITIVFANEGSDAYQPEEFGNKIIVERKIQRTGATTSLYAIKSLDGRVKSTKKAVLDDILYKFVITIDNPLAFLSQDRAREFLASSSDTDKYNYFMQGAHILDILANYERATTHIVAVKGKVDEARRQYTAINKRYNEIKLVFDRYRESNTLRTRQAILFGKIYWFNAHVIQGKVNGYETKLRDAQALLDHISEEMGLCKEEKEKLIVKRKSLDQKEGDLKDRVAEHLDIVDSKKRIFDELVASRREAKDEVESKKSDIKRMKESIVHAKEEIVKQQQRIDEINGELKEKLRSKLDDLKQQLSSLEEDKRTERLKGDEIQAKSFGIPELDSQINQSSSRIAVLNRKREELSRSQGDKYAAWGAQIKLVIRDIENCKDWHKTPMGPLGAGCKLKPEYTQWTRMLTTVLRKSLDSFVVCDGHDRQILEQILQKYLLHRAHSLVVRRFETFNYEASKPRGQVTVDDMLEFADKNILYTLIDMNLIERMAIVSHKSDIERVLNVHNVNSTLSFLNNKSGQRSSKAGSTVRFDPVFYRDELAKFANDSATYASQIAEMQDEVTTIQLSLDEMRRKKADLQTTKKNQLSACDVRIRTLNKQIDTVGKEMREIEGKLKENGDFARIASLQLQIVDYEEQISRLQAVVESLLEDIHDKKEGVRKAKADCVSAKEKLDGVEHDLEKLREEMINLDTDIATSEGNIAHYTSEQNKKQEVIDVCQLKIKEGLAALALATSEAEKKCARLEVQINDDDTAESIAKEYEEVLRLFKQFQEEMGRPLDEVENEVRVNLEKKRSAEETLSKLDRLYKEMDSELRIRYKFLTTTIELNIHNALRTFENCLELRGFKGQLSFVHSKKELKLLAKTRNDLEQRSMESLSGGEKSYAQIALLLSIWKVMDSRVRGLDEFDVFMDSVNRSISIRLLLRELRQYPKSQSIFITPQDIAAVGDLEGSDVKIHKMRDPRRE